MVHVIGLTGGLGSGKTSVAAMFKKLGAKVIDADKIAHLQLKVGSKSFALIVRLLGKEILTSGRIDRRKVAQQVFKDRKVLKKLEHIIHPAVQKEIIGTINRYKKLKRRIVVVIDVPLLFESGLDRYVDETIVVKANRATQVMRATKLLGITRADAMRRIKMQMPLGKKIRLADMIIDNNGALIKTKKQVKQIWEKL